MVEQFGRSFLWSAAEMFGAEAPLDVEIFRRENPIQGFTSQLLGNAIPGLGYVGAAARLGRIGRGLDDLAGGLPSRVSNATIAKFPLAQKDTLLGNAAEEVARALPFEAVRAPTALLVSQATTDDSLSTSILDDALGQSVQDLALAGAIGGVASAVFGRIGQAATNELEFADSIRKMNLDADVSATQLLNNIERWEAEAVSRDVFDQGLIQAIPQMKQTLRRRIAQEKPKNGKYSLGSNFENNGKNYFESSDGIEAFTLDETLPRIGDAQTTPDSVLRTFGLVSRETKPDGSVDELVTDIAKSVQFPRVLRATKNKGKGLIHKLKNELDQRVVNNGQEFRYKQEIDKDGNRGAFVVMGIKEIGGEQVGLTFRATNLAGIFEEASQRGLKFTGGVAQQRAFADANLDPKDLKELQADALYINTIKRDIETTPIDGSVDIDTRIKKEIDEELARESQRQGVEVKYTDAQYRTRYEQLKERFADQFAPSAAAFTTNPLARNTLRVGINTYQKARNTAFDLVYGAASTGGRSALGAIARGGEATGGLKQTLEGLDKAQFTKLLTDIRDLGDAGDLGDPVLDGAAAQVRKVITDSFRTADLHRKATDAGDSAYGLNATEAVDTVTRVGSYRAVVVDKNTGTTVGVLYGTSSKNIARQMQKIREKSGSRFDFQSAPKAIAGKMEDIALTKKVAYNSDEAKDFRGYVKQVREAGKIVGDEVISPSMTQGEFLDRIYDHVLAHQLESAKLSVNYQLAPALQRLMFNRPEDAIKVMRRLGRETGEEGEFSKTGTKILDKILQKEGRGKALLGAINEFTYATQLGFLNMSHAALTLMTPFQTVSPELSFLMRASPERISRYYTMHPMMNESGDVVQIGQRLSPYRIMNRAASEVIDPDDNLKSFLDDMVRERFLNPAITQEFLGRDSDFGGGIRDKLKKGDYVDFLRQIGTVVPRKSEEMTRLHTISTAYVFGRDVLKMRPDSARMKKFVQEFTDQTMYQYNAGDRANVLTGTIGSTWGLYKNFIFNYIAQMRKYGLGVGDSIQPMLHMALGTTTLGGVGALGPTYFLADQATEIFADQSFMEYYYSTMREDMAFGGVASDALFFGAPSMLGVSLQSQVQQPGRDPLDDAGFLLGFAQADMFRYLAKSVGTAYEGATGAGIQPFENDLARDQAIRAITPKFFWRFMQTAEGDAIKSLNSGYPLVADFSEAHRQLSYMLGFNDLEATKAYTIADELWKSKDKQKRAVSQFGRLYAEAARAGDYAEMSRITRLAVASGLPADSVLRSANSRIAKAEQDVTTRGQDAGESAAMRLLLGLE